MDIAKWFFIGGAVLFLIGALIWAGLPIGRLPGDFSFKGEHTQIYIPLASSIILSLFLTLIIWLLNRFS
ncbi:MAG: DUF2905 domain-containing protein [Parachlamydiaceae bacterium]